MKTLFTSRAIFAIVVLFGLVGYNFMNAAWTPAPAGTPPTNNTEAPINTGSDAQVKLGGLSTGALVVNGNQTITAAGPRIRLDNTTAGQRDYWLHTNNSIFYILADRNNDGVWTGESPWPLEIMASTSPAGDYAMFSNKVRATEYCDRAGRNCVATLQQRIASSCSAGQAISGINPDGSVTCITVNSGSSEPAGPTCSMQIETVTGCGNFPSCPAGSTAVGGVFFIRTRCSGDNDEYGQSCQRQVCS